MSRRFQTWYDVELAHINLHWRSKTDEELAEYLERTPYAVRDKRKQLGLFRDRTTSLSVNIKIRRMKELIALCEANPSPPIKDGYKLELMKLSGLW